MLTKLLSILFGCRHSRYSFPQRSKVDGKDYVSCLDCGKSHEYVIGIGLTETTDFSFNQKGELPNA